MAESIVNTEKTINWEYLISLTDAGKKYHKDNKTLNRYILKGKLEEGVDCIKVGNTWLLDDRRVQTFFNNKED